MIFLAERTMPFFIIVVNFVFPFDSDSYETNHSTHHHQVAFYFIVWLYSHQ
jgi:hypothetical protein